MPDDGRVPPGRVLVLGNATVDLVQNVRRFPRPGETLLAERTLVCAGGKGLNQAVAAARTGVPVELVAACGNDANGHFLAGVLAAETNLLVDWRQTQSVTDLSTIWIDAAGENVIVSSADAAASITAEAARACCAALGPGDMLVMQGNLGRDPTVAALREARGRGVGTVLNTAPTRAWMAECMPLADIVVANALEARQIAAGRAEADTALLEMGARTVVITRGKDGATLATDAGRQHAPAPAVAAQDSTGAGDVFTGTFAGLLAQGYPLPLALVVSVRAASICVTRPGTTPSFPSRAEIAGLLAAALSTNQGATHA
jgi:ribokinase